MEALLAVLNRGARAVLLDLTKVDYISSAGLLALDAVSNRVQQAGGELVLCGLVEPVRLAFDSAGLLPHFGIDPRATSRSPAWPDTPAGVDSRAPGARSGDFPGRARVRFHP